MDNIRQRFRQLLTLNINNPSFMLVQNTIKIQINNIFILWCCRPKGGKLDGKRETGRDIVPVCPRLCLPTLWQIRLCLPVQLCLSATRTLSQPLMRQTMQKRIHNTKQRLLALLIWKLLMTFSLLMTVLSVKRALAPTLSLRRTFSECYTDWVVLTVWRK